MSVLKKEAKTPTPDDQTSTSWCLALSAPFEQTSRLADLISEMDEFDPPAVSIHESPDPTIWTLQAYYEEQPDLERIERHLARNASPLPPLLLEKTPDEDWVALVQSGLSPIRAGRYFIHGSHDRHLAEKRAGDIEIEAGQAFGTAHHGTTKGCLLALDHLFKRRRGRHYQKVLDLGTGSGLLAIAAARSLRHKIIASDIDPISVKTAIDNATLNEVGPLLEVSEANGLAHHKIRHNSPYDLLLANILAAPLLTMAPAIKKAVKPGGHLILSGLLRTQSRAIEARYREQGFRLVRRLPLDEWMTLILQRR